MGNAHSVKISPKLIYNEVSKKVVGQEYAKKVISNAIFLHFVSYVQMLTEDAPYTNKPNVLITGPSGCGKTLIVREACSAVRKITGVPVCGMCEIDCTSLSAPGWVGQTLEEEIYNFCKAGKEEKTFHDSGVIFLDEFDKLCKAAVGSGGTDHNRTTQYSLLKCIEGKVCEVETKRGQGKIDTSHMLFILAGNFSEIRLNRQLKDKQLGFVATTEESYTDLHVEVERAGAATQIVGRIPYMCEIDALTEEELKEVLINHTIPMMRESWKPLRKQFEITDEDIDRMVESCKERGTGARGLQTDLVKFVENQLFECELRI